MLIYHPAFDHYHCAFRALLILLASEKNEMVVDRLRIVDFYLLFPAQLNKMSFTQDLRSEKKKWKSFQNRFNRVPDPRRFFDELEPFQKEGLSYLLSANIIAEDKDKNVVAVIKKNIPKSLLVLLGEQSDKNEELIDLLVNKFDQIDLYGNDGLKRRTNLFEYRYDVI